MLRWGTPPSPTGMRRALQGARQRPAGGRGQGDPKTLGLAPMQSPLFFLPSPPRDLLQVTELVTAGMEGAVRGPLCLLGARCPSRWAAHLCPADGPQTTL